MPNWAYGHTDITGTKAAILSFVNRYIFPDEPTTIDGVKYFARSFLHVDREEIKAEIEEAFRGMSLSTPRKKECGLRSIFGVSGLVSLARNPVI